MQEALSVYQPHSTRLKGVLNAIGNTPLFTLGNGIFAKAEFLNPSGSIKDRMALFLVEQAEKEHKLLPGYTIVEATSGNTGNALSMIAAAKGYNMRVLMPSGYTSERSKISIHYGATVEFVGDFQVNEAREKAYKLGVQQGYFCPAQFDNEVNVYENCEWLGREIVNQLGSGITIDAIVQGVGTGGTLIGVGQALRKWNNPDLKVFAVEPAESQTLKHGNVGTHKIEGISDGFVPDVYARHKDEVTDIIPIQGDDAVAEAMNIAKKHGVFVGPSSGANSLAAEKVKADNPRIKTVLTFLCDRGEKYLSEL